MTPRIIMNDFFKYLNPSQEDKNWGMHLAVFGKYTSHPNQAYPQPNHPNEYFFSWEKGRTLNEYQIILITQGEGTIETQKGTFFIETGSILIIRKNEWHRYQPNPQTGWVELFVGFNGILADHFLRKTQVLKGQTVINCGFSELIYQTYSRLFNIASKEFPGSQHVASSCIIELLANIASWEKQKQFTNKPIEQIIEHTKLLMRENIYGEINLEQIANNHHVTYSYLRRMFKDYTGIAPHKYFIDMKIIHSKELLITSNLTVKEVSYRMGFSSEHYFSRLFKQKTGLLPSDLKINSKSE
ncbi:MAG: AraC family transcriptional regulator [Mangrovibacterium sp.]